MIISFISPNPAPIGDEDFKDAAVLLGCEVAVIKAVAEVEAGNGGFLPSGKPKILFESHIFSSKTGHIYDLDRPDISTPKWTRNYKGGEQEYERLEEAIKLDYMAALMSCSWGKFQIMGFNYEAAGYGSVESFVRGMVVSERNHLLAFVSFIRHNGLADHLKHYRWTQFARAYNGPGYAQNKYDTKLLAAYERHAAQAKKSVVT